MWSRCAYTVYTLGREQEAAVLCQGQEDHLLTSPGPNPTLSDAQHHHNHHHHWSIQE